MRRNTRKAPNRRRRKVASRRTAPARSRTNVATRRAGSGPVRRTSANRSVRLTGGQKRSRRGQTSRTPARALRRTGRVAASARRASARRMGGARRTSAMSAGGGGIGNNALHPSNKKLDPRITNARNVSRDANTNLTPDQSLPHDLIGTGAGAAGGIQNVMNQLRYRGIKNKNRVGGQVLVKKNH
jgi:hypothetical protein